MKNSLLIISLLSLLPLSGVSALILRPTLSLQPSLTIQMQKQAEINATNTLAKKKAANLARLQAIAIMRKSPKVARAPIASQKTPLSQTLAIVKSPTISSILPSSSNSIVGVDMSRVRDTWFGWYNSYRTSLGLGIYTHDPRLDSTAHDWNREFAAGKGSNHHTRNPGDGYYNFPVIDNWFISRGINPRVINRAKHTENVGYGYYSCSSGDCTESVIRSIRTTFDFFMSEKGKAYDAHYRSIIQPHFTKMGFDIIVVPGEKRYYITVHYITE